MNEIAAPEAPVIVEALGQIGLQSGAKVTLLVEKWPRSDRHSLRVERTSAKGAVYSFAISLKHARELARLMTEWIERDEERTREAAE